MAFTIKSSNAQNNTGGNSDEKTMQNQLIEKENKTKGGFCKGKATEKLLKSELDRILDKKKYDIRILDARQSTDCPCLNSEFSNSLGQFER